MTDSTSQELFQKAQKLIPGGVNSPVRAFGSVGGTPVFFERARGARLWDVDGREYVDLVGSWGPMILGHCHPAVEDAVLGAVQCGMSFGAPTAAEVELAERVVSMVPCAEMVRLVNSGTEATMTAIRLARGATGRNFILKFEGCYHGHGDSFLIKAGSGALTLGIPSSPGVPGPLAELTLNARFNDLESVHDHFERHGKDIAAVIVEPVAGNMGTVPPEPGFLEGLRRVTAESGALLVFDEVMTGFRLSPGGAQQLYDVVPDLCTLAKVLGGGLPIGAIAGKREILENLAPIGAVYQAGTLSGNPIATAAGNATLKVLQEGGQELYDDLDRKGARLEDGLHKAIVETGIQASVNRVGSMLTLFFNDIEVKSLDSLKNLRTDTYGKFFHHMLDRSLYFPPSQYEAFFLSTAHSDADIDRVVTIVGEGLKAL
jgi:glutamate-1-semialdehyde 2,1-aminomutase